jgi:hypothetical protein
VIGFVGVEVNVSDALRVCGGVTVSRESSESRRNITKEKEDDSPDGFLERSEIPKVKFLLVQRDDFFREMRIPSAAIPYATT